MKDIVNKVAARLDMIYNILVRERTAPPAWYKQRCGGTTKAGQPCHTPANITGYCPRCAKRRAALGTK